MNSRKAVLAGLAALIILVCIALGSWQLLSNRSRSVASAGETTFAGSEVCAGCHQTEGRLWHGSQHQRAMAHATEKSVLGNFNNASYQYFDVQSRFFAKTESFSSRPMAPTASLQPIR